MASEWQRSFYWRALEEAKHALGIGTREHAMIAILLAIIVIVLIWFTAGRNIAASELLIRLASTAAIFLIFPLVYVWKFFTIPAKSAQIVLGTGTPYETIEPHGVTRTCTVRVKLQNNTRTEISNGKLQIRNLDPPTDGYKDFLLKDHITIGPHGNTFIGVAAYSSGISIHLIIPPTGEYLMSSIFNILPIRSHTFYIIFSSLDEVLDEIYCRFFVNFDHILKLEEWS
jgi:hypothetical protein